MGELSMARGIFEVRMPDGAGRTTERTQNALAVEALLKSK
jgi:hypothetical protein